MRLYVWLLYIKIYTIKALLTSNTDWLTAVGQKLIFLDINSFNP